MAACSSDKEDVTTVIVHFRPVFRETMLLEKLSSGQGKTQLIDSVALYPATDSIVFKIPVQEQQLFRLRIRNNPARIFFINDAPVVNIYTKGSNLSEYHFSDSTVNGRLRHFLDEQLLLADNINKLAAGNDSLQRAKAGSTVIDSFAKLADSLRSLLRKRDITFSDTTNSPGIFLFLNNRVDFGKDFTGLKKYITNAVKRFPQHAGIHSLAEETLRFVSIQEEEYNIGDIVPDLVLPNQAGIAISLNSLRGKFVFIDFWSPWCPQCVAYSDAKNKMKEQLPGTKFETVSIALTAEKDAWKKVIYDNKLTGVQLIDEKMWRGKTAETFKIDSIPFNFLISPEGKILAKAIKKDAVWQVVSGFIK